MVHLVKNFYKIQTNTLEDVPWDTSSSMWQDDDSHSRTSCKYIFFLYQKLILYQKCRFHDDRKSIKIAMTHSCSIPLKILWPYLKKIICLQYLDERLYFEILSTLTRLSLMYLHCIFFPWEKVILKRRSYLLSEFVFCVCCTSFMVSWARFLLSVWKTSSIKDLNTSKIHKSLHQMEQF